MILQQLKKVGLKKTPGRISVLEALSHHASPVDVNELVQILERNNVTLDKVTVYRILEVFVEKGLIERVELQEGKFRYEVIKDHHHHFVCTDCGSIEDMDDCCIDDHVKNAAKKHNFLIEKHALEFYGRCGSCQ